MAEWALGGMSAWKDAVAVQNPRRSWFSVDLIGGAGFGPRGGSGVALPPAGHISVQPAFARPYASRDWRLARVPARLTGLTGSAHGSASPRHPFPSSFPPPTNPPPNPRSSRGKRRPRAVIALWEGEACRALSPRLPVNHAPSCRCVPCSLCGPGTILAWLARDGWSPCPCPKGERGPPALAGSEHKQMELPRDTFHFLLHADHHPWLRPLSRSFPLLSFFRLFSRPNASETRRKNSKDPDV